MPADPNASTFLSNPIAAGNTRDAANWYQKQGYQWTPSGWQQPYNPYGNYGGFGSFGTSRTGYERNIPSWYPKMGEITAEASKTFGEIPGQFSTRDYQQTVDRSIGDITTTAKNAASNAAAEYAARVRQSGGTAEGAGLIKAQGLVGAEKAVGDIKTEAAKFALEQREKAATLSGQIATNLGNLRNDYLATITGYMTKEDELASRGAGAGRGGAGGGGGGAGDNWSSIIPNAMGLASGLRATAYNAAQGAASFSANPMAGSPWNTTYYGGG